MMSRRMTFWIVFAIMAAVGAFAAAGPVAVSYLSAENVYLNAGRSEGLAEGDTLLATGKGGCQIRLVVVFVADHSAACSMTGDNCQLAAGDQVTPLAAREPETSKADPAAPVAVAAPPVQPPPPAPRRLAPSGAKINGSLSFLIYHWNDQSDANLDFTQSTARFNLRAQRLFGKEITFVVRSRGRYDQRQRAYSSDVQRDAWENRIWECSIAYGSRRSPVAFQAGRILPQRIGGAGYLDGLLVESGLSPSLRVGLFAGREPDWAYAEAMMPIVRTGGYLSLITGLPTATYYEQAVALVNETSRGTISRRYVALQGRFGSGQRFTAYHTAEIDFNSGWRRDAAANSVSLSSLYLGSAYRLSERIRLSLNYDSRTNYRTLETRSIVDSLFDDHMRHGVRTQLDFRAPLRVQTSVHFGLHKRNGDSTTTKSYGLSLLRSGLWRRGGMVLGNWSHFTAPSGAGDNLSLRGNANLHARILAGLGYGFYRYQVGTGGDYRKSYWTEISSEANLSRQYYLTGSVQLNGGDDLKGVRLQTELGYRF